MNNDHIVISTRKNPAVLVVKTEAENVAQVLLHHCSRLFFVENTFLNVPYQNSSVVTTCEREKLRNKNYALIITAFKKFIDNHNIIFHALTSVYNFFFLLTLSLSLS
jgi:hypothetical protein